LEHFKKKKSQTQNKKTTKKENKGKRLKEFYLKEEVSHRFYSFGSRFRECGVGLASNANMSVVDVKPLMVLLNQNVVAECRATCSTIHSLEAVLSQVVIKASTSAVECFATSETEVDGTLIRNGIVASIASHVSHFLTICSMSIS